MTPELKSEVDRLVVLAVDVISAADTDDKCRILAFIRAGRLADRNARLARHDGLV